MIWIVSWIGHESSETADLKSQARVLTIDNNSKTNKSTVLINFDTRIYLFYEDEAAEHADRSSHHTKANADNQIVTKVQQCWHEALQVELSVEEVDWIQVHPKACHKLHVKTRQSGKDMHSDKVLEGQSRGLDELSGPEAPEVKKARHHQCQFSAQSWK